MFLARGQRACGLLMAFVLAGAPSASAATRVVFTVDVESNQTYSLPDQVDAVCVDAKPCGLMEISRLLQARGWAGTFFLNVYEERRFGAQVMREIARRLQASGQDVELHTHPD